MTTPQDDPAIIIIPARMGSTRLPAKALLRETGKSLTRHVVESARGSRLARRVVVAADDRRIIEDIESFGGEAVLTGEHPNGTARLAEAASILGLEDGDIVANVQGDEPEIDPALIDDAITLLRGSDADITTVVSPFAPGEDPASPSIVKAVLTRDGRALYFSRALIPYNREGEVEAGIACPPLKHVGLYVYRCATLKRYADLPECPIERSERLEQLRALDDGMVIRAVIREATHHGIDTRADYEAFVDRQKR